MKNYIGLYLYLWYVGILFASGILGPVVGFIGGGLLLELYTHFDTVDTSTSVCNASISLLFIVETCDLGATSWVIIAR